MFVDYVLPPLDGGSLPPRLPMEWGSLRDALPHVNPSLSSHGPLSQCKLFCCHGDKTPPAVQQFPVPHHPLLLCCLGILCGRPWQNLSQTVTCLYKTSVILIHVQRAYSRWEWFMRVAICVQTQQMKKEDNFILGEFFHQSLVFLCFHQKFLST